MDQLFNLLGVGLTWVVAIIGGLLAAFWVGLIIWTWRDIRSRSADIFAALLAVLLVAVFNVIGLLIYILVRPKQTLAEQYDRALEEEILLQELEQSPTCHNCGRPVKSDWQYCPYCEAELKRPCPQCGYLLEPDWKRCPKCGAFADKIVASPVIAPQTVVPPATQAVVSPPTPLPDPEAEALTPEESEVEPMVPPPPALNIPEAEAIARAEEIKKQGLLDEN